MLDFRGAPPREPGSITGGLDSDVKPWVNGKPRNLKPNPNQLRQCSLCEFLGICFGASFRKRGECWQVQYVFFLVRNFPSEKCAKDRSGGLREGAGGGTGAIRAEGFFPVDQSQGLLQSNPWLLSMLLLASSPRAEFLRQESCSVLKDQNSRVPTPRRYSFCFVLIPISRSTHLGVGQHMRTPINWGCRFVFRLKTIPKGCLGFHDFPEPPTRKTSRGTDRNLAPWYVDFTVLVVFVFFVVLCFCCNKAR